MPIIKSATKRMRQANKRRDHNRELKRELRAVIKNFTTKPTQEGLATAQSQIDKAVKKGLLKLNTASRKKASLSKIAKANNVKLATATKAKATATKPVKKAPAKKATPEKSATKAPAKKPAVKKAPAKKATK